MKKTLIVGVGSILRGDDAVGPRVIDELKKEGLPQKIRLERGDLSGLDLLKYFPDFSRIIIIDAADIKEKPGTVKVFRSSQIKNNNFIDAVSTHGMALRETLALASKLDIPSEVIIVAVQAEDTSYSLELSNTIKKRIPFIANRVKKILLQGK